MSTSNPAPPPQENKGSKRRKNKSDTINALPADASQTPPAELERSPGKGDASIMNGTDGSSESPFLRELNKNVRNIRKKLAATQKVDSIVAENPDVALDQLLADRKINADQKAQAEKKPALKAQLAQLEEQLEHYKKFDEDTQKRFAVEKEGLETSHREELERVKQAAYAEAKAEDEKSFKDKLLSLSKFLRAAAARRQDGDESAEENRAFEGALLLVYGGDAKAVTAMENLINGSDELVPTVESTPSNFTYKHVRDAAADSTPPPDYASEEPTAEDIGEPEALVPAAEESSVPAESDPAATNAGLTEIDSEVAPETNGASTKETLSAPEESTIGAGAANTAAEANLDKKMPEPDRVEAPRDPADTDTGVTPTPAANTGAQSWAEDVPAEQVTTPANDGFHEVHHNRGRGRGHGEYRGRGRGYRGEYRGRGGRGGERGDYRGRGRGGRGRGRGDPAQ